MSLPRSPSRSLRRSLPRSLLRCLPRWTLLAAALAGSAGCGVRRYLPGRPVLDAAELAALRAPAAAPVAYTGPPRGPVPVLPLQVFGLFYDLDVVIVSDHPSWDMHEYARVDTPTGPLWLAKDSRAGTLVQGIVAEVPDIETFLPEVPVPRRGGAVRVQDRGEGDRVDLQIAYENLDGAPVEVQVRGRVKPRPPGRRNGSTMGHSRASVAVVLDLARFGPAGRVRMHIDGERRRVRRLLGLVPLKFLLHQAQGGIAVTSLVAHPVPEGLRIDRPGPDPVDPATGAPGWPTHAADERWTRAQEGDTEVLTHTGPLTTTRYGFEDGGLRWAEVRQAGRVDPVTRLDLCPALPDLRRPFDGRAEVRFALSVNGQEGHGTGTLGATWQDGDTVALTLRPTGPWWLADRPMDGTLRWQADGAATLSWVRVDVDP